MLDKAGSRVERSEGGMQKGQPGRRGLLNRLGRMALRTPTPVTTMAFAGINV
jgi:hypothetical protein